MEIYRQTDNLADKHTDFKTDGTFDRQTDLNLHTDILIRNIIKDIQASWHTEIQTSKSNKHTTHWHTVRHTLQAY